MWLRSSRLNSKHKMDGQKVSSAPLSPGSNTPAAWHNGDHTQRSRNGKAGRLNHAEGDKGHDVCNLVYFASPPPHPFHPLQRFPPQSLQMSFILLFFCWLTWIIISFDIERFVSLFCQLFLVCRPVVIIIIIFDVWKTLLCNTCRSCCFVSGSLWLLCHLDFFVCSYCLPVTKGFLASLFSTHCLRHSPTLA